eukprot:TRINITY_DN10957_c0_g1_i1.p1 TRINITY_DN10957_c0_g1~~TRINITY_DN10957_c0_g1_i1.p1  ORF type:complete len:196 (+),score=42.54 TRINITY_DN10957_c0_g1_i1:34-588(+)
MTSTSKNPICYFDISIDGKAVGRIEMELRADVVPKTVENFRCLCTAESKYEQEASYKGSKFHGATPGMFIAGGQIAVSKRLAQLSENKEKGMFSSIYGGKFKDENFTLKPSGPGDLIMSNTGKDSNTSQFFIALTKMQWLTGRHVVFGKVTKGMEVVKAIEKVGTKTGALTKSVKIDACGQLKS